MGALHRLAMATVMPAALLLAGCAGMAPSKPLACDDGIKAAFKPDGQTTVVAVRAIARGTPLVAVDSPQPITAARDLCLVKLLVGPGIAAETDKSARSYSEGIGIEVWLPAAWNERIRNYGGGGWVGGGHRYADQIGSKVPALVNANLGYASGTTDGGQPWYQDGSFAFLSSGAVNTEGLRNMAYRAMVEQAVKTRALVAAYYGKPPKYAYYDGHSQGGRQGLKIAQEHPEFYDGYLIGQPAVSITQFGLAGLYPQVVMRRDLGISALDKTAAAAFARKVALVNARAVASCDQEQLGFLLDPFGCAYDPLRDAGALCSGVDGIGITGSNGDAASCMSAAEARALNKIWYGPTTDGSYDGAQTTEGRGGRVLGAKQLWWGMTRGTNIAGQLTSANTDLTALALQDVRIAADAAATAAIPITNGSTPLRNRWQDLDYTSYAAAFAQGSTLPWLAEYATDKPDLRKLHDLNRKMILWNGLADDVIPPAGAVHYHERVKAVVGGETALRSFLRMYNMPGMAHSSQGRTYTVGGKNNSVPMPPLPGNANQTPAPEQDLLFTALVAWVERGSAPGAMTIASRDGSVSYPVCVYPLRTVLNPGGSSARAADYGCR